MRPAIPEGGGPGPLTPLGQRLSPERCTAKFAEGPPLAAGISKGCARRITIALPTFLK